MIDKILDDLKRTHVIVNAEAGHGKSSSVQTIIQELKHVEPKTIVKVFDVSQAWFHKAPLPQRQLITVEKLMSKRWLNINDCVYEMGELSEDARRYFAALVVKQDYDSRRNSAKGWGIDSIKKLPRIIYIFEEADTYFDSRSLNKKDAASETLRDFIKIGRNFGLRGLCVVTACAGELGTKLRRRSTHLIGKILSDEDIRYYNRRIRGFKLGNLATETEPYHWIYYNGSVSEPFRIEDLVENVPIDYIIEQDPTIEPTRKGTPTWVYWVLTMILAFAIGLYFF